MTSENVTEAENVESSEPGPSKAVDDRLIDELVSRAQAGGPQLTGEGGLLQQLTKRLLEDRPERLRHHLRQPPLRSPSVTPTPLYAVRLTVPTAPKDCTGEDLESVFKPDPGGRQGGEDDLSQGEEFGSSNLGPNHGRPAQSADEGATARRQTVASRVTWKAGSVLAVCPRKVIRPM